MSPRAASSCSARPSRPARTECDVRGPALVAGPRARSSLRRMKAATATIRRPRRARGEVSEDIAKYVLIGLLLLMPVVYRIHDLSTDGNLTRLATNIKGGLSNDAILALIAIGYTLVYGIIELINFAHGDVFMIGTFVSLG